jgi:uncharacterized alkaline shock family protein YloU
MREATRVSMPIPPTTESMTARLGTTAVRDRAPGRTAELVGEHGKTTIADSVVAKIVAMATREVGGVYAMGAGAARLFGAVRERVPGTQASATQGVAVEVGERQAAVDLDLVIEYGVAIPDLAAAVRSNVITAVERMCGLEVTEVNISVDDIHLPGDELTEPAEPRVQ